MESTTIKEIRVDEIKGGEILAKDVYLSNGTVFMSEGSQLKVEYKNKLKGMNISKVCIVSQEVATLLDKTTEKIIEAHCREVVRATIDKYSYGVDAELKDIVAAADNIMQEILSQEEIIYNVSKVRDKSEATYLHSINVAALSVLVGSKLHLSEVRLKNLAVGALLHDIGMIYVPVDITKIEIDKCDAATMREIHKHVIYGYSAVEREDWISTAAKDIIINHHERLDGSGFPFRLTGDKMTLETKIVALCDEFDSMVYGNMMKRHKVHEAIDILVSQAGIKYDFKAVQAFIASVAVYPIGSVVVTNDGETAMVVRQNSGIPTRPVLKILSAPENGDFQPGQEKDLAVELTTFIRDTIG